MKFNYLIGFCLIVLSTSCVRQRYIDTDNCSEACYELVGIVLDDSSKLPIEGADVELKLEKNWKLPLVSTVETDSLGRYSFFVSDTIVQNGFDRGSINANGSYYFLKEAKLNMNIYAVGTVFLPEISIRPASSIGYHLVVNKENVRRLRITLMVGDSSYVNYTTTIPVGKPYYSYDSYAIPANEDAYFSIEYATFVLDSLQLSTWIMLDSFPKNINLFHKERAAFEGLTID